jgi:hypothetical protein
MRVQPLPRTTRAVIIQLISAPHGCQVSFLSVHQLTWHRPEVRVAIRSVDAAESYDGPRRVHMRRNSRFSTSVHTSINVSGSNDTGIARHSLTCGGGMRAHGQNCPLDECHQRHRRERDRASKTGEGSPRASCMSCGHNHHSSRYLLHTSDTF